MTDTQAIINQLGALSYFGIFGVAIISNIIIPVPEEVVLIALGYLAGTGKVEIAYIIPIVILGLFTSDFLMYYMAKRGSRFTTMIYEKLYAKRLASKQEWLRTHIEKVIFLSRFMIQLRFLGPFLAGQMKVPTRKFVTIDLLALLIYVPLFTFTGSYFRNRIEDIVSGVAVVRNVIFGALCLIIIVSFVMFVYKKITKLLT